MLLMSAEKKTTTTTPGEGTVRYSMTPCLPKRVGKKKKERLLHSGGEKASGTEQSLIDDTEAEKKKWNEWMNE